MKKLSVFILVLLFLGSCDLVKFGENINKNPNLPNSADPSQLLANAMLYLPGLIESPQGEYFSQFLSKTIYQNNSFYDKQGTGFYSWYQGPLMNLQRVIQRSEKPNEQAVAKILKAYFFWNFTDRWGPIPYSEALQGTDNLTPAYDSQQAIYTSLFDSLEAAANQINVSGTLKNDIIYNGNMAKWKKLANSIRLLMALRLSEVDPATAKQEFTEALNDGVMESNDDNLVFQHLNNQRNQNFWYGQIVVPPIREWWALSEGLVSLMKPYNDPRLSVYGRPAAGSGDYIGLPFGTEGDITKANYSLLGTAIYAQDAPAYLLTYAQVLFAKAEAAARGWISGSAETFYNKAVTQSILMWTGSTDGAANLLAQPEIAFNPATAIQQIAQQRYIHLFMNGYEAWSEWRRLGYPKTMNKPKGRGVPLRLMFSSEEQLNNTDNYEEAIKMLEEGNSFYSHVWWDVN